MSPDAQVMATLASIVGVATPILTALGAYIGIRTSSTRIETRLDELTKKVDRMESRGDTHTGDISKLREEVSVSRTQILALHQEIGAIREEQGEARDFANATHRDVAVALQEIAVLKAKAGITPTKNRT
ncbi:MAG: hypothetical protein ACRC4O_05355 [Giesbergeria sp.]